MGLLGLGVLGIMAAAAVAALIIEVRRIEAADQQDWQGMAIEAEIRASILQQHLAAEKARNEALLRVNFELMQANEQMQHQANCLRMLPAWSSTIVFN